MNAWPCVFYLLAAAFARGQGLDSTSQPEDEAETEPPEEDLAAAQHDDAFLLDQFYTVNLQGAFERELARAPIAHHFELLRQLGVLALYFRLQQKHVLYEVKGYHFGYPDGVGYKIDRNVTQFCGKQSNGIRHCVRVLYELITGRERNAWLTRAENVTLSAEFLTRELDPSSIEQDLTVSQILCHFTMRFDFFAPKVPFCSYDTLPDEDVLKGSLPRTWNGEKLQLFFDSYTESDYACAIRSFCPNPCDEELADGSLAFKCPIRGAKCHLLRKENAHLISLRHNNFNESCACAEYEAYHKDAGICVLPDHCLRAKCPRKHRCINTVTGAKCICQLGYYRSAQDECQPIGQSTMKWQSLAVSSSAQQLSCISSVLIVFVLCLLSTAWA